MLQRFLKWLLSNKCWCEYEYYNHYPKQMENKYLRPVTIIIEKCKKCWKTRQRKEFTDLLK